MESRGAGWLHTLYPEHPTGGMGDAPAEEPANRTRGTLCPRCDPITPRNTSLKPDAVRMRHNAYKSPIQSGPWRGGVLTPCGFSYMHKLQSLNMMNPVNPSPTMLTAPFHTLYSGMTRGHATDINCWNQGSIMWLAKMQKRSCAADMG